MNTTSMLWHYTFGHNYQRILADQAIKPMATYVAMEACPVVWFSRNQIWEAAATKGLVKDDGTVTNFTMEELGQHGGGLYRIGVAQETAPHNWDDFVRIGGIARDVVTELRRIAKKSNASRKDWFASFEPVKQSKWLALEVLVNHKWVSAAYGESGAFIIHAT
jgi:hypothetical protein